MFTFEFDHLHWLSQFCSEWRQTSKLVNFQDFCQGPSMRFRWKIWKWLKLLNSLPFIKKPLVNQVYIRIWSLWLTFTVLHWMKKNSKNVQISSFLLSSRYVIQVKIWKWLKLLNSVLFTKKTLVNQVYIRIWSSWLTFTVLQWMKANFKISQFSRFLLRSEYEIQVKNLKMIKTSKFCSIHQELCWLTFTVLQWMKTNFKIGQFWRFLLRSEYAIQVKIWKWLKLLNSVPFTKKTLVNHIYIRIWSCWLTFTVLPCMKKNSKNNQFSRILLRSEFKIQVKIWKWLKLLNSVPFIKKKLVNQVCIWIWSF